MNAKKSQGTRMFGWAILPLLALAAQAGGCIIVEDDTCTEGALICSGDFVEECIDDIWVPIEDCFDLCGGNCVYIDDETACLCPG